MVKIEHIKKYRGGKLVLDDVSLSVRAGEVVVLLGASGAGKTSLLRTINQLDPIDSGNIEVGGPMVGYRKTKSGRLIPVENRELKLQRREIGFVFQHFNLFPHMTVLENIWHAPVRVRRQDRASSIQEARDLLAQVGLSDKADAHPNNLSGGQQQRVAIARALAMHPTVMLFDEPTSALDPEMTREVLEVMKSLARKNMSMIIVTHEMAFAREAADRIVVMDAGRIIESGSPQQVFDNPVQERTREFFAKTMD
ncbi:amino acid ABC transporter ATP-binding protein [Pseudoclavibacter sp. CFCC 13796]|nr:amino acid ABC transporter ATP-binding protein [Pseudoclavibacter sp. CFCC 11306]KAB1662024.1 amino acid ABC transporter ATP-binding protein [Pseudoclavibacter sp. CFCC 13796]